MRLTRRISSPYRPRSAQLKDCVEDGGKQRLFPGGLKNARGIDGGGELRSAPLRV